jgi:hypothetical protein
VTPKKALQKRAVGSVADKKKPQEDGTVRAKISAEMMPRRTLEQALVVAEKLHEVYARESANEGEIAQAMGFPNPTNTSRYLLWSALGYGIITKNEDGRFSLSETGRKIVAETYQGEAKEGRIKAVLTPTVLSKFYTTYNGHTVPAVTHLGNLLETRFGVPRDRTGEAIDIIMENARFASILEEQADGTQLIKLAGSFEAATPPVGDAGADDLVGARAHSADATGWDKICFYITPIGDEGSEDRKHADLMLKHLLVPVLESKEIGFTVVRADGITRSGIISQQIFEHLAKAKICVADLSFGNPNAFYELGVRHVCQLPTIQIIRKGDRIPFDVSQGRTIIIDTSDRYTLIDRIDSARRELAEHVKGFLTAADSGREDNPISIYLPELKVTLPK